MTATQFHARSDRPDWRVLLGRIDGGTAAREIVVEVGIGPVRCLVVPIDNERSRARFTLPERGGALVERHRLGTATLGAQDVGEHAQRLAVVGVLLARGDGFELRLAAFALERKVGFDRCGSQKFVIHRRSHCLQMKGGAQCGWAHRRIENVVRHLR